MADGGQIDPELTLVEVFDHPALRGCQIGPLFVQAWSGQPMPWEQDALVEALESMMARYPGGFASLSLVRTHEAIGSLDAGLRKWALDNYARLAAAMSSSAIVIDSDSLGGRSVRLFVKALLLVARPQTPTQVFASLDEACAWLTEIDGATTPALVAEAAQIRESIRAWWGLDDRGRRSWRAARRG